MVRDEKVQASASKRAGQPKGDKRARTRTRLLDAALDLVRETGFEHASLQAIAARAGMTTGAIYGNFGSRDQLFIALAERQWGPIRPKFRPGSSFAELMTALAQAVIDAIPGRKAAAVGAFTFRAYALRHEEVRHRFRDSMAAGYEAGAAWIASNFAPDELPMAPTMLVRTINALIEGLLLGALLTPELVGEAEVRAAFAALSGHPSGSDATRPTPRPRRRRAGPV